MESLRWEPLSLLGALASERLADELSVGPEGQPRVRCSRPLPALLSLSPPPPLPLPALQRGKRRDSCGIYLFQL